MKRTESCAPPSEASRPLADGFAGKGGTSAAAGWLVSLLQLNDTFYPTGAYAHSFGLEGLIAEGLVHDRATLKRFLESSLLPSLRQAELPLVHHAWHAFSNLDWETVGTLSVLSSAMRSAREARAASEAIGRQRAELCSRLREAPLAREYLARAESASWPFSSSISAALEARVLGAPLEAALSSVCYAALSGSIAASMKLLRLGQNGAQSLLTELLESAPPTIEAALAVSLQEIGWFNPWLDIASARHETAAARLFIS